MDKIGICQRKMLRKIVGWTRHPGDSWETVMRVMKEKVTDAMSRYYVRPWEQSIRQKKIGHLQRVANMDGGRWEKLSKQWDPTVVQDLSQEYHAYREQGRPRLRWNDITT